MNKVSEAKMKIRILDTNYDVEPRQILGSISSEDFQQVEDEITFCAGGTVGIWKIHDFSRSAPLSDDSSRILLALVEVGECEKLTIGSELTSCNESTKQ